MPDNKSAIIEAVKVMDEAADTLDSLHYRVGSLEQQLKSVKRERDRLIVETARQRETFRTIQDLTEECIDGEDGTCRKCAFCLAYYGLWGKWL